MGQSPSRAPTQGVDSTKKAVLAMKHTSYALLAKSETSKNEEDAEVCMDIHWRVQGAAVDLLPPQISSIEASLKRAVRECEEEYAEVLARSLLQRQKARRSTQEARLGKSKPCMLWTSCASIVWQFDAFRSSWRYCDAGS